MKQMYRIYNYPWSGRLGRIADRCLYCGDNGTAWQISSSGTYCYGPECRENRRNGAQPLPELEKKFEETYERLAREWCQQNGYWLSVSKET